MSRRLGNRFVLDRELGSGGMSTVYLGTDEVLDRPVAIKVLKPEFMESDIGARFRREGRTAARLSHPNIVQIYDAGEDYLDGETASYIVMEHVSGGDLRNLIHERGTLSGREVAGLSGVAAGLAHAHERGIVHRDVKPHNILLGENGQPKLADFGIARALDATQATRTGMYLGTARYSSPEQLQGEEVTPKSDIYSLGATLYEAVTGELPFGGTPIEIASQHVSKPPTPPGELAPVDEELEALILACLAKVPEDRPDAAQVQNRLLRAFPDTSAPRTYAAATGSRSSSRRTPLLVALAALFVVLGGAGAFSLLDGEGRQAQGPAETVREPTTETAAEPAPQPTVAEAAPSESGPVSQPPEDVPEERAAAQTVREVYELAAAEDYGRSYDLLSQGFKQGAGISEERWRNTFTTLERISFLRGPDAEVTGDVAQVTGVTRAVHTNETQRNTAEWTLVRENGEWKLDSVNIIDRELI